MPPTQSGPNDQIRAAVIGIRSRGKSHIEGLRRLPGVQVVALCDVDQKVLADGVKKFEERGEKVDAYTDMRRIMERDDIDVVATATPNHWHALLTIWACETGKDVYVEKPVSHNVSEGRRMVEAAEKHGRIVQTGTQARSSVGIAEAIAWVQEGNLGKIRVARGLCYKPRKSIGKVDKPTQVPDHIDYDLWCGPAPNNPLMRKSLHYDWHWQFVTGNGDLGNQGIHQMDMCRWALGRDYLAPRVMSVGGRFGYTDDGDTPNTQICYHDYGDVPLIFEVRGLPRSKEAQAEDWRRNMNRVHGVSIGAVIECEGGNLVIPDYNKATAYDGDGKEIQTWAGSKDHFANFIDAVRSRKPEDLRSDILQGHLSSGLCHTGNISYLLGQDTDPAEVHEQYKNDAQARETFDRFCAHLDANEVDVREADLRLGPWLQLDPRTERFTDERANALLTREYRKGFEVPDEV